jgi:cell division protein FtsB
MTSPTTPVEDAKVKGSRKLLAGVAVVLGVVLVAVVLFSHRGLYQIYRFGHERLRLNQENARLAEENARLARTIDRLQHDPEMIQDLIRRELNFVKKNEILFQLPPDRQSKSAEAPAPAGAVSKDGPAVKPGPPPDAAKKAWTWESLEGAPKPSAKNHQ